MSIGDDKGITRRGVVKAFGAVAGAALAGDSLFGQQRVEPPSTISNPPRDFDEPTTYFQDPDILTVDPSFQSLVQPQNSIKRLWTGGIWLEGPAWSGVGRYLVFSDIPNNRQMRWSEDDGRVTVFRNPANNSNGNHFDFQGRQLSCEHLMRRVVRYEHDGSVTIIADNYGGKRLNSPNDVVTHPDGSYWFTDPPFGGSLFEGQPDAPGGGGNPMGLLNPRLGLPPELGTFRRELPTGVYRVDPAGKVDQVVGEDQLVNPNGLAFSPDYKRLYVISSAMRQIYVFEVANNRATNGRVFSDMMVDGVRCGPDGVRCDVYGNVWCSSNAGRAVGYNGVTVWNPNGMLIGRVRLPEVCANVCFGGPKRNRLFMMGSTSVYSVHFNTQGAAPS
jgi:gluconolactonase